MRDPYTDPKAGDRFEGNFGVKTLVTEVVADRVWYVMSNGAQGVQELEQWPEAIRHARLIRRAEEVKPVIDIVQRLREIPQLYELPNPVLNVIWDAAKEIERLRSLISDVANSGVELPAEPPGLMYFTVQIDADLWDRLSSYATTRSSSPLSTTQQNPSGEDDGS